MGHGNTRSTPIYGGGNILLLQLDLTFRIMARMESFNTRNCLNFIGKLFMAHIQYSSIVEHMCFRITEKGKIIEPDGYKRTLDYSKKKINENIMKI